MQLFNMGKKRSSSQVKERQNGLQKKEFKDTTKREHSNLQTNSSMGTGHTNGWCVNLFNY